MNLQLSGTANDSIVDGPGLRFTIFVQGCPHRCKGCHNPQTHDFNGGTASDTDEILEKIKRNPLLDGVTFSGGEPFCQALPLAEIGRKVHELGLNIITYTGFTFEELYARRNENGIGELLKVTDYLIDGPFIEALKSYQLQFRGSANQRILDCRKSLESGCAVETEFL
ncbi:MAG: anaerobic ribonucleoside-triphosphate reductase activating protein [Ruminococcus sp.]|nr:anaerobic ribonucleoside-triphosphate reductase activating protein [Ruminococcus sp.]